MKKNIRGLTMIELIAVVAIIVTTLAISWASLSPMSRRNEVLNCMRYIRASVTTARAKAIEFTQPVRMTFSTVDGFNRILVERDPTRDGDWSDAIIVIGESVGGNNQGDILPFKHIVRTSETTLGIILPHWTGMSQFGDATSFQENWIVLYPDGTVMSGNPLVPTSGTYFIRDDRNSYYGAVHVTAMGEVKMAYASADAAVSGVGGGPFNGWYWTD